MPKWGFFWSIQIRRELAVSHNRIALFVALVLFVGPVTVQAGERFVPGHIFVGAIQLEGCQLGYDSAIREIDPRTDECWIFTDQDDGLCNPLGLIFTPDGKRLRVANYSAHNIVELDPEGTLTVIYDQDDGLRSPGISNGMAFDAAGAFFVIDSARILKFPADGGDPLIFADADDGITYSGGLDFGPSGDLYLASRTKVLRFTPEGTSSIFDDLGSNTRVRSVVVDEQGNLFVGVQYPEPAHMYRYDQEDPGRRRLLTDDLDVSWLTLAMSPDHREVYATVNRRIYAIDRATGQTRILHEFPVEGAYYHAHGIAVFVPPLPGDINGDEVVAVGDHVVFAACMGGPGVEEPPDGCDEIDFRYADLDFDYDVDLNDFTLLSVAMGK